MRSTNITRPWLIGAMTRSLLLLCLLSPCCHGFALHATPLQLSLRRRSNPPLATAREVNPRQLTALLRDAASPTDLFVVYTDHGHEFNQIHIVRRGIFEPSALRPAVG